MSSKQVSGPPTAAVDALAGRLDALLDLGRVGRDRALEDVLRAVGEAMRSSLGFRAVVINVYRPAYHDYEATYVDGDDGARAALLHTTNAYELFHEELLLPEFERVPGAFFLPDQTERWSAVDDKTHVIHVSPPVDENSWREGDGLLLELRGGGGDPLGVISVDAPLSERRPDDADLLLLVAIAAHAGLALETVQMRSETHRHERALAALLSFASRLPSQLTCRELLERGSDVAGLLGYRTAAILLGGDDFEIRVRRGHLRGPPPMTTLGRRHVEQLLVPADPGELDGTGCRLLRRGTLTSGAAALPTSTTGRGPRAWGDHELAVPMYEPGGRLVGVLVLDEPCDGLRPCATRRQEGRLLADQIVAALGLIERQDHLVHLASHDALTGLRNRRDLEALLRAHLDDAAGLAVAICDLDHFKSVNDTHGHDVGDRVLERFAQLLRERSRDTDIAVRLGGEEFCLLLPGATAGDAARICECLRRCTPLRLADVVGQQTVSIGIAAAGEDPSDPGLLLAAADAALYEAKRRGRNRIVVA